MRKATIFIVLAFLLVLCAAPVYAQGIPSLPHAFYGSVTVNGSPAPIGTDVEARGEGVLTGIEDNPIRTTVVGVYGTTNPFEHRLIVQGDIEEGATISFYVNGVFTDQTAEWHSGETTELNLTVNIAEGPPPTGAPSVQPPVETNLFGTTGSFKISRDGETLETIEATSEDGMLTITIPEGTIALDKDGDPLETLEVSIEESWPEPEEGNVTGLAYDFGPDGATFDPPITFTWSYDPEALPEGVAEGDLVLAYYDEDAGEWVELDCVVDTENNTITASVSHFTIFAIIGVAKPAAFTLSSLAISPAEVAPGEIVNVGVSVANTGGTEGSYTIVLKINGVKEAEKRVAVAAGSSQSVSFSVTKEDAGTYSVAVDGLSGSFIVVAPVTPLPAAFSLSDLSIQPAEVQPKEPVTITATVANTGGTEGSYSVVLKINGAKKAEKSVNIAAGGSQNVTFSVTKEEPGSYSVAIDGLSGSFTVVAPPTAPSPAPPVTPPAKPPTNWPLIGGIVGAVIVVGLLVFFLVRRRST